ncbi:2-oxo-4-hydroxy-4-carboxy-5-ureidoimidazoline decarboxylase [Mycolicibacterium sp. F2034L]|uniref:2-oxo-4-hydroxy-4-carboxy-5-ureidoimidazoline decarboxylase n=1 Tax=Mycolicibacterium sp. F2034L TaxID=2926422 RepID=UPI001FF59F60|nr:2-oxo-4-hydroxy-4-carboxy-5-ureidoimidazoline decarboxylase [Mycolicibacterium sp. F2034L]MCK0176925.1 2-oxo-4-hydroxy-4-carboxy-5-ureidoimidazoline decarboxylase [Mycolicibacterium sp. F2034L]
MLMHQCVGLDAYNTMPLRRAVHAVYECCFSVPLAADLARTRPYLDRESLYRHADELLFALSEEAIDDILQAHPDIGRRPGSAKSAAEQCAVYAECPELMGELATAAKRYVQHFGFGFVMYVTGHCAADVLAAINDRLHHDRETERKVVRHELSRINRSRLERMLGPEGGYHNW